jgi:hypothetical protein
MGTDKGRRDIDMSEDLRTVVQEHRAFYEVLPYYIVVDDTNAGLSLTTRRVHAGFDVDIYGESLKKELVIPGPDSDYTLSYSELQKVAQEVSRHATDSCSLEVLEFPETVYFDLRRHAPEALLRVRISHCRGLNEPAGLSEQRALAELEKELKSLGVARR